MNTDQTETEKNKALILICENLCLSVAAFLVIGVGIEPTFRAFQTRANPSQLSDQKEDDGLSHALHLCSL